MAAVVEDDAVFVCVVGTLTQTYATLVVGDANFTKLFRQRALKANTYRKAVLRSRNPGIPVRFVLGHPSPDPKFTNRPM